MVTSTGIGISLSSLGRESAVRCRKDGSHPKTARISAELERFVARPMSPSTSRQFANGRLDPRVVSNCGFLQRRAEWNRDVERGHAPGWRVEQVEAFLDDYRREIRRRAATQMALVGNHHAIGLGDR